MELNQKTNLFTSVIFMIIIAIILLARIVFLKGNLDDQGKLLLHDTFTVWEVKKSSLKHFTKLGGKTRQVFMFERSIIFSKKEYENGKELGTYLCKLYLNVRM